MVAILVPLTITGTISMGPAVIGHEGSTVLVVFNALRLLAYKTKFKAIAEKPNEIFQPVPDHSL
jgi:cation transport ATPase